MGRLPSRGNDPATDRTQTDAAFAETTQSATNWPQLAQGTTTAPVCIARPAGPARHRDLSPWDKAQSERSTADARRGIHPPTMPPGQSLTMQ